MMPLPQVVNMSQVVIKVGFLKGSVMQFSVYCIRSKLPWRARLLAFEANQSGGQIHSSILGAGGAVLRSEQDQGGQAGSHTPEHHRTGELLTVTEYLFATGTQGAEAHGCLEDVIQAQVAGRGSKVSFWQQTGESVAIDILGRSMKVGGAL